MTRKEQIEQQTFVYYESCSDEDVAKSKGFIDGAQWADEHPSEKAINKRLYELGYGMSLNGDIITRQQVSESMERYVKYKKKQLIDKAVEWLSSHFYDAKYQYRDDEGGWTDIDAIIEDFRKAMEE